MDGRPGAPIQISVTGKGLSKATNAFFICKLAYKRPLFGYQKFLYMFILEFKPDGFFSLERKTGSLS